MKQVAQFCTIILLISLSCAQSINEFFGDDADAGLVSFDPINIEQSQGIFGNNNQQGEDSIGGIFADEQLTGRETFGEFSVGGDFFAGGGDAASDDVDLTGSGAFSGSFGDDILSATPIYRADGTLQVDQLQQDFQQDLFGLFN